MRDDSDAFVNYRQSPLVITVSSGLLFQAVWFVNVLTAPLWSAIATLALIGLHLLLVACYLGGAVRSGREAVWVMALALCGLVIEHLFFLSGLLQSESPPPWELGLVPGWLFSLWLIFATLFAFVLRSFHGRLLWLVLAGFSASTSYYLGARLNPTVDLAGNPIWTAAVIGVVWAIVLPVMSRFYVTWIDRSTPHG